MKYGGDIKATRLHEVVCAHRGVLLPWSSGNP